ncbi:hypothetical protein J6590_059035 [Homalodisca vitripennis]|nr:hypothetical protein J6590_059035 [Homalodisca vitripennis]
MRESVRLLILTLDWLSPEINMRQSDSNNKGRKRPYAISSAIAGTAGPIEVRCLKPSSGHINADHSTETFPHYKNRN